MKTKTLTCGIRIDDNRSINCGVSIVNQSNPMFILSYSSIDGFGFYSRSTHSMYMHNVNDYLTALNDIITAMAEANEFVAVKDEPEQEESEIEGCIYCIMEGAFENGGHSIGCPNGLLS